VELSSIISIIALIISVLSFVISFRQIRYTQAQVEIQIRGRISEARKRVDDFLLSKLSDYSTKPSYKDNKKYYDLIFESLIEEELNAYEEACQKYIDNKVDRARFKKTYKRDIARIFVDENFSDNLFNSSGIHDFECMHKVRELWELPH
jgi:hypothetical protein